MDPIVKFRIFFTNFDYYSQEEFSDSESALEYGKSKCFEFSVNEFHGKEYIRMISSWSPIGGTRYFV